MIKMMDGGNKDDLELGATYHLLTSSADNQSNPSYNPVP
jgi:hypothetical protein